MGRATVPDCLMTRFPRKEEPPSKATVSPDSREVLLILSIVLHGPLDDPSLSSSPEVLR